MSQERVQIANVVDTTRRGKYYETSLELELSDGRVVRADLTSDDPEPSTRALEDWESREEFERENCDGHYEREATRLVADLLAHHRKVS
jgi:hypothetical protein